MCNPKTVSAIDIVQQHWHPLPEWVRTLAMYCDEHTQAEAARKIGKSASLVNQVLKAKYPGNLSGIKELVETAFNVDGVACPVLGDIDGSECLKHQATPYNPVNHLAVSLFRACRRCPRRQQHGRVS